MKCRSCWTDKAYLREEQNIKESLLTYLGCVPLKCHHCYDKFWVPFYMTWGQRLHPPKLIRPADATPVSADSSAATLPRQTTETCRAA